MYFRVTPHVSEEVVEADSSDDDEYGLREAAQSLQERERVLQLLAQHLPADFSVERALKDGSSTVKTVSFDVKRVENPQPIRVDAQQKCELLSQPYKGRYFVYLMSHSVVSKTDSHVGYSTNPIIDILCHNRKIVVDRNTCMAAPFWVLDIVLGPFSSLAEAVECARIWVSRTRGKEPKRDKGEFLAGVFDVDMYSYRVLSEQSLVDRLECHDSSEFVPLYKDLLPTVVGAA